MKRIITLLLFVALFSDVHLLAQSVAINADGSSPDTTAMLDVKSTTKGLLIPRMTMAQRLAINPAAPSMIVYQTDGVWGLYQNAGTVPAIPIWQHLITQGEQYWTLSNSGNHIYNTNAGNVGIGVTTPPNLFTVGVTGKGITQQSTDGTTQVGFYTSSGSAYVQTHTNHPLYFTTNNGGVQMALSTAGNLGIGTSAPAYKLDVNGRMRLTYNGNTAGIWFNKQDNSGASAFAGNYDDSTWGVYTTYGGGWQFLLDHKNSKMGINVVPKVALSFPAVTGKKISLYPGATGDVGMGVYGNEFRLHSDHSGADITFGYDNYTNGFTERMRVKADGRVCIGTTSPASGYLLNVNGKIISEEVRVLLKGNWPDYVFDNGYALRGLPDVEQYIKQYKHLPDVPSADEVKTEGHQLGDIQVKLLQKVEELTLYMIEADKKIKELQERIDTLEQKK